MKEAQTGIARLEDVDKDTFVRVCQFATQETETPVFIQRPDSGLPDGASSVWPSPNVDANEPGEIAEEPEPEPEAAPAAVLGTPW
jgi:hypothetical protein